MKYIVLLRGINVGGKNKFPMKLLIEMAIRIGATKAKHHIQSGNLIIEISKSASETKNALEFEIVNSLGFHSEVFIYTKGEFEIFLQSKPDVTDTKKLLFCFTMNSSTIQKTNELNRFPGEQVTAGNLGYYLYLSNGIGQAKLTTSFIEKNIGSPVTTRNLNTTSKLLALIEQL